MQAVREDREPKRQVGTAEGRQGRVGGGRKVLQQRRGAFQQSRLVGLHGDPQLRFEWRESETGDTSINRRGHCWHRESETESGKGENSSADDSLRYC
jgi:hypothetical protein